MNKMEYQQSENLMVFCIGKCHWGCARCGCNVTAHVHWCLVPVGWIGKVDTLDGVFSRFFHQSSPAQVGFTLFHLKTRFVSQMFFLRCFFWSRNPEKKAVATPATNVVAPAVNTAKFGNPKRSQRDYDLVIACRFLWMNLRPEAVKPIENPILDKVWMEKSWHCWSNGDLRSGMWRRKNASQKSLIWGKVWWFEPSSSEILGNLDGHQTCCLWLTFAQRPLCPLTVAGYLPPKGRGMWSLSQILGPKVSSFFMFQALPYTTKLTKPDGNFVSFDLSGKPLT